MRLAVSMQQADGPRSTINGVAKTKSTATRQTPGPQPRTSL